MTQHKSVSDGRRTALDNNARLREIKVCMRAATAAGAGGLI